MRWSIEQTLKATGCSPTMFLACTVIWSSFSGNSSCSRGLGRPICFKSTTDSGKEMLWSEVLHPPQICSAHLHLLFTLLPLKKKNWNISQSFLYHQAKNLCVEKPSMDSEVMDMDLSSGWLIKVSRTKWRRRTWHKNHECYIQVKSPRV